MGFDAITSFCGALLLIVAAAITSPAQTYKVLIDLNETAGSVPYSGVVQGLDGNLYGTAANGGANNRGSVVKITPTGTLTTMYSFCAHTNCVDGSIPQGGLVLGTDGNFYGTTVFGGTGTTFCGSGCGTIFKITPAGALTTLHSFCTGSTCLDGDQATSALVQGTDGNFYGTASSGGANSQGTVFKITPMGTLTTLYAFCSQTSCADGQSPLAGLIQATNGAFYGTTSHGGANGYGEVFEITSSGTLTVVHSFDNTDGADPTSRLVQGASGTFYGMTQGGGSGTACFGSPCGTIFKMTSAGVLTTLVSFDNTNGASPEYGGLVQGSDGNFYGTTPGGGANGDEGTIFKITPAGALTTLYSFCAVSACDDGDGVNSIMQATSGILYGTAAGGGTSSDGVIFSLTAGLKKFVQTLPGSGRVGGNIKILGNALTGATAVSFNGTAATFKVVSASEITATVPTGATTGKVSVTTSAGTVISTVGSFRVP